MKRKATDDSYPCRRTFDTTHRRQKIEERGAREKGKKREKEEEVEEEREEKPREIERTNEEGEKKLEEEEESTGATTIVKLHRSEREAAVMTSSLHLCHVNAQSPSLSGVVLDLFLNNQSSIHDADHRQSNPCAYTPSLIDSFSLFVLFTLQRQTMREEDEAKGSDSATIAPQSSYFNLIS
ncbi:hypothetical protein U1Q18_022742 [Sarracenia purpurea var. burkii]